MIRKILLGAAAAALVLVGANARAASTADIIFVVDESGSMSTEHAWLSGMVTALEADLVAAGVTGNQYGLVGFGSIAHDTAGKPDQNPHQHTVGAGAWGTAAQLSTATSGLVVDGGEEDGWAAINFALNNYVFRSGAAINIVLVTDEDRDNSYSPDPDPYTYANTLAALTGRSALLNAVVNASFKDGAGSTALGIDSDALAYKADGSGGYTTSAGGYASSGSGTTIADYVNMAIASGGAAWDLNQLRAGGLTAASFTEAFVDIKVGEIQQQPVPDGGSAWMLLSMGVIGLATVRRRLA